MLCTAIMMDPVSVATIVATTTSIFKFCVKAGVNLDEIWSRWKEELELLNFIKKECCTFRWTMRNIRTWFKQHEQEMNADNPSLIELSDALTHCCATLERLESFMGQFHQYVHKGGKHGNAFERQSITIV